MRYKRVYVCVCVFRVRYAERLGASNISGAPGRRLGAVEHAAAAAAGRTL